MNRAKLIAVGTMLALSALALTRPAARSIVANGVIGFAEMTEHVCPDPCSILNHTRFFLWCRFDPTCPQCM
jgi:hypothetical protein